MRQISGFVLVKETNSGLPNLVVAAYDTEKSIQEISSVSSAGRTLLLKDVGKRIGSVLTNHDGKFVLNREELEFPGNETRPDLLLVVFAPEDIQSLDAPYPLPPEERILYISSIPRTDAGAEESFLIRLLQGQLDHFHITVTPSTNENNVTTNRLATAIEGTWNFGDNLRQRLQQRLQQEQKKSESLYAKARENVQNLSAIPMYLRNSELRKNMLLIHGKQDLAHNLQAKQEQAIANGLERLQTLNPIMHLRLSKNDLKDLGLKIKEGKIVGDVNLEKLTEKVGSRVSGFDLVRKRGLNNPSPTELIEKYLSEKPAPVKVKENTHKK